MSAQSWDRLDPAPLEFFHGEVLKEFHNHRNETSGETTIPMNGITLSVIIAKSKRTTHAKYPQLDLKSPVKKGRQMNKSDARKIAETITNEQLKTMFDNAKTGVKDWTVVSNVNKGMTKGAAWNILASKFDVNYNHHVIAKTNMVREFGDFLPSELKPQKKTNPKYPDPVHFEPNFLDDLFS